MSKKEGRLSSKTGQPCETDDLKLIIGIGPAVEKRLQGVGIFTFAQLATLSPADIAAVVVGLSGLSTERITKQDWIGQARKLASEPVASDDYLAPRLQIKSREDAILKLTGSVHVLDIEMIGVETSGPRKFIALGEPFDVRLTLDLSQMQMSSDALLHYKINIYSKSSRKSGFVVGEKGTIAKHDKATIMVKGIAFQKEDIYRLTATLIFGLAGMKLVAKPGTTAIVDGGLLEVY